MFRNRWDSFVPNDPEACVRKAVDINDRNVLFRPCRGCPVALELAPVSHEVPLDDPVMPAPCDDEVCDIFADDDNEEGSEYPSADVGASEGQF